MAALSASTLGGQNQISYDRATAFVDVFDNAGTLIGVTYRAGLTDAEGKLPRMKQALIADSFAVKFALG